MSGEGVRSAFEQPQRGGKGIQSGINCQLVVILGVIAVRIDSEAAGRAVLEPLINGQDVIFPVPPRRPCIRIECNLAFTPGVSPS